MVNREWAVREREGERLLEEGGVGAREDRERRGGSGWVGGWEGAQARNMF